MRTPALVQPQPLPLLPNDTLSMLVGRCLPLVPVKRADAGPRVSMVQVGFRVKFVKPYTLNPGTQQGPDCPGQPLFDTRCGSQGLACLRAAKAAQPASPKPCTQAPMSCQNAYVKQPGHQSV